MKLFNYLIGWFLLVLFLTGIGFGFYFMHVAGFSSSIVTLVAFYTVTAFFSLILFIQKRQSGAKLSWLIVLIILPFVGHVIFVIFGQRYKGRNSFSNYLTKQTFEYEYFNNPRIKDEHIKNILKHQSQISHRGVYKSNIEIFPSGDQGFEKLFKDMRAATKSILINFYIIKPGEIYEEFKEIIIQKAKQGVEVKLIVDDFGRWALPWYELKELNKFGIKVGIFGKVFFPFISSENGYRTHRKLVIIDGTIVHTGGINVANEYANLNKKYGYWLDFQTKITGEASRSFLLLFIDDWKITTSEVLDPKRYIGMEKVGENYSILVEDSPEIKESILESSIVKLILNAKKSIKLVSPYFIPTSKIIAALKTAAMSGVKIKLIIPGKPDKKIVLISTRFFAREMMEFGIQVYETRNMLVHSKMGIFDDKLAYFGTANIDYRSFYSQFEFISILAGPSTEKFVELFEYYLDFSSLLTINDLKNSTIKDKFLRIYTSLLAPIM